MSVKKAWAYERDWIDAAIPPKKLEDNEKDWMSYIKNGVGADAQLFTDWLSFVPGSKAPCHLVPAAIAAMQNRGYDVSEAERYIEAGLKARDREDGAALSLITSKIYRALARAPKNEDSHYWKHPVYLTFADVKKEVDFKEPDPYDVFSDDYMRRVRAGWTGQLIGGCLGTQLEGYTTANIRRRFGEIYGYVHKPETYNDDITYELAYLSAFERKGYKITSEDIADEWLLKIADGYSAERIALENLRRGIMPPESGRVNNYFSDWIGAQMRTPLHGMLAPGNPALAARLAADDSVISHSNNGMLGGIFNAVLICLCFTMTDIREVLVRTAEFIPKDSEYHFVINLSLGLCHIYENWEDAWKACEKCFERYNWIHAYPNAAAEVIALWYGQMDFDETAHIIAMEGQDVDCTAAPVLNALGVMCGPEKIRPEWIRPIGDTIHTIMRGLTTFTIDELCERTCGAVRKACRESGHGQESHSER